MLIGCDIMYLMMKKGFIVLFGLVLFWSCFLAEAQNVEVSVRFSESRNGKRIVFESSDEIFIRKTSASISKDSILVRFPSAPVLRYKSDMSLDLSVQGNIVSIRVKEPFKMNTLFLSEPPRFSIDILTSQTESALPNSKEYNVTMPSSTRIIIDPGHGGYDPGIINGDLREKDISLAIAREMESMLLKKNRPVFLIRRIDQFLSITDRSILANQKTPGIFISIHLSLSQGVVINIPYMDASASEPAEGMFDMMHRQRRYVEKSKAIAEAIGRVVKEEIKTDVVYREIPVSLLNSIGAPAVLIEFAGNLSDDKEKRSRLSMAILKGIEDANQ